MKPIPDSARRPAGPTHFYSRHLTNPEPVARLVQLPRRNPAGCNCALATALVALVLGFAFVAERVHADDTGDSSLVTLASSEFDDPVTGTDGWKELELSDGVSANPRYEPLDGASGGSIASNGDFDYFSAPAKFLGDQHRAYGGRLRFALKQNRNPIFARVWDVQLKSAGMTLACRMPQNPPLIWTNFEFPLLEGHGWVRLEAGRAATLEEFLAVLSRLEAVWICCNYAAGYGDRASLDEVELLGPVSGPAQPELTLQRLAVVTLNGEVGARYQIEYRPALGQADQWTPLAEVVLASRTHQFVDADSAGSETRFYRATLKP